MNQGNKYYIYGNLSNDEFEAIIGKHFSDMDFDVMNVGGVGDHGVDILVSSHDWKYAVQVKKYVQRLVGADVVRYLWKGAQYYDADKGMIVSLNGYTDSATNIAKELGMFLVNLIEDGIPDKTMLDKQPYLIVDPDPKLFEEEFLNKDNREFEVFYQTALSQIRALIGSTVEELSGKKRIVCTVDENGVSHTMRSKPVELKVFRWAIFQLWSGGKVTRQAINTKFPQRVSSFCFAVLRAIPLFEFDVHRKRPATLTYNRL